MNNQRYRYRTYREAERTEIRTLQIYTPCTNKEPTEREREREREKETLHKCRFNTETDPT